MAVLNDDRKNSNPRAASVRIQADTMSGYSGQRRHDLRIGEIPNYVDEERVDLNRTLITPPTPAEMRNIAQERRGRRETQRKMKCNAAIATAGIITFGSQAAQCFGELSQAEQDQAFMDLAEAVARRLNTSLHSLVIHGDEATIHAHFHLCAYDFDGLPLSRTTRPQILSELQDLTAEVMQRYCQAIERGTRYGDRLAAGANYADVINKSVKQLHRELPADLARKRAEVEALEHALVEAQARAERQERELEGLTQMADLVTDEISRKEEEASRRSEYLEGLERARAEADAARAASEKLAEIAARVHQEQQDAEAATRTKLREVEDRLADLEAQEQNARASVNEMQGRVDKLTAKESLTAKETKRLETYQKRLTDRIAELEAAAATAEAARADAEAGAARVEAEAERIQADADAERFKAEKAADAASERARAAEAHQAKATARAAIVTDGLKAVATELAAGTLRRSDDGRLRAKDPAPLRAAYPEIKPVVGAAVEVVETAAQSLRKALEAERDALRKHEALEQEKANLEAAFDKVMDWMRRLEPLIARFTAWLNLPGLPESVRDEGLAIMWDATRTAEEVKQDGPGM